MKVFNSISADGTDSGEVILQLSQKEAQGLVSLISMAAEMEADKKAIQSLRRRAKPIARHLENAALCF